MARGRRTAGALTLAPGPRGAAAALRAERAACAALTAQIAARDQEIEARRAALSAFDARAEARLGPAQAALDRVRALLDHLERQARALARLPTATSRQEAAEIRRHAVAAARARQQALRAAAAAAAGRRARTGEGPAEEAGPAAGAEPGDSHGEGPPLGPGPGAALPLAQRLRLLYRDLARRSHPDLARDDADRADRGRRMAAINAAYRDGDLAALEAIALGVAAAPEAGGSVAEQLAAVAAHRAWLASAYAALADEQAALEATALARLAADAETAAAAGRDLLGEMVAALSPRIEAAYHDLPVAARHLEAAVREFNRRHVAVREADAQVLTTFDPHADRAWLREARATAAAPASPRLRARAAALTTWAERAPARLRLVLLAYVTELSPLPLAGLESYADLVLRFDALSTADPTPVPLEVALVAADQEVAWGIRRAPGHRACAGLQCRDVGTRDAVPLALERLAVRRAFVAVLGVVGEHARCAGCRRQAFMVPLFVLRGLDELHAMVCPRCGSHHRRYFMPQGQDMQAVLGAAMKQMGIVHELTCQLGRASVALQLAPRELQTMTVADLAGRLHAELFARHQVPIAAADLGLAQGGRPLPGRTPLRLLAPTGLTAHLAVGTPLGLDAAVARIRAGVRARFAGPGPARRGASDGDGEAATAATAAAATRRDRRHG